MTNPFFAFLRLVEIDHAITRLQNEYKKYQGSLAALEHEREAGQESVHAAQGTLQQHKKELTRQDLELLAIQGKEKALRAKLETVASAKEWAALDHELQAIVVHKNGAEALVIASWDAIELSKQEYTKAQSVADDIEKRIVLEVEALRPQGEHITVELQRYQALRTEALVHAPQEYMKKYESMRETIENPVVPVIENCCSVCASLITRTDLTQLQRHLLVPCRSCYRLLYLAKPEEYR